jgi:hypothetical protein
MSVAVAPVVHPATTEGDPWRPDDQTDFFFPIPILPAAAVSGRSSLVTDSGLVAVVPVRGSLCASW